MIRTYGSMPTSIPDGYFKAIEFPVLALLDTSTGDHRRLSSEGTDVRELPLSIRYQPATSFGHDGAVLSGALFEVTVDPEQGKMSGRGFMLNDANGRAHARYIYTGAMRGNSIDTAEVQAQLVENLDTGEWYVEFVSYKLAATTGVSTPAFGTAHATIADMSEEELMASLGEDPMVPIVAPEFTEFTINVIGEPTVDSEITASAMLAPFDAFYVPEADGPQKVTVTADRTVSGHLGLWESCLGDRTDVCLRIPRPRDGYASFNKPGPLTERGQVETGPIFAYGGHRPAKSAKTIAEAYGGIENAWCDVRVVEGRFGPWLSGVVRPGVPEETVYAARASRISGHWVNGSLKAIVSVNAEGFDVPGSGLSAAESALASGFHFRTDENHVAELVASFPLCAFTEEEDVPVVPAANATAAGPSMDDLLLALLLDEQS